MQDLGGRGDYFYRCVSHAFYGNPYHHMNIRLAEMSGINDR